MKELIIRKNDSGQRLDKYLKKYLNNATAGFIYKMLRKKNITLNGRKADGSEIIAENDSVKLFLADETINNFRQEVKIPQNVSKAARKTELHVLYEDDDILLVNKPSGILSQKSKPQDISINEIIIDYLVNNGTISIEDLSTFKPSVCNRLDRNTSGIITFGKSLRGAQELSEGLKNRTIDKYYLCVVKGIIKERAIIDGYLTKNIRTNKVMITSDRKNNDSDRIYTEYLPVCNNDRNTLLKIKLHTGKTHQIRAHLASIGNPLIGDFKYGDLNANEYAKKKYGVSDQILHAFELYIPGRGLRVYAPMPDLMKKYLKGEGLWEPGNQGDLEVLH